MNLSHNELYNSEQDDKSDALYVSMHKQYKLALERQLNKNKYYEEYVNGECVDDTTIINLFLSGQQYRLILAQQYLAIDILETKIFLKEKGVYK